MKGLEAYVRQQTKLYFDYVVEVYSKAGQAMVEDARGRTKDFSAYDGGSFGNITWNLRSSIGCSVFQNGVPVFEYYPVLNTGAKGSQTGKDYARSLVEDNLGIVLVVVAGMDYARAVEDRNFNVITATALEAEAILERYIQNAA